MEAMGTKCKGDMARIGVRRVSHGMVEIKLVFQVAVSFP
jgi:hypothetical protein